MTSPATLAARALRAIPSTARTAQSRANGARGGRPVVVGEIRYTVYGGARYRVDEDGAVRPWDEVAGHYTLCHSLVPSLLGRIRARARGPEGRTSDR